MRESKKKNQPGVQQRTNKLVIKENKSTTMTKQKELKPPEVQTSNKVKVNLDYKI